MEGAVFIKCLFLLPIIIVSTTTSLKCSTKLCLGENVGNITRQGLGNISECCRNLSTTRQDSNLAEKPSNETLGLPTSVVYTTMMVSKDSPKCLNNNSICTSDQVCLSYECFRGTGLTTKCLCHQCLDGRCFNNTRHSPTTMPPTSMAPQSTITTLQLVLLFGSMGGIIVIICIVYCVKSFTDNRRRQYLLKHGVWDPPREGDKTQEENEKNSNKSGTSKEDIKMDVPTIHVQMENEISRSKDSRIETVQEEQEEDEISDVEEILKPQKGPKVQPDAIQVKGYVPIPNAPNDSPIQSNANSINPKRVTNDPYMGKTIGPSIQPYSAPSTWGIQEKPSPNIDKKTLENRPSLQKSRDPPKKIIANGTPEKSPKFNNKVRTASPPKLVEPENFSDFGM